MLSLTNLSEAYVTNLWTGWKTNAWPSYAAGNVRWQNTNDLVRFTNVWCLYNVQVCTVSNSFGSTNIPGWSTNGYVYSPKTWDGTLTGNSYWEALGVQAGTASNLFTLTNTYLTSLRWYNNSGLAGDTNSVDQTLILTTAGGGLFWFDEYRTIRSSVIQTNLLLNASDVRGLDCYRALTYFADIPGAFSSGLGAGSLAFFYRTERAALAADKAWVLAAVTAGEWVNKQSVKATYAPWGGASLGPFARYNAISLCTAAGAPTNYLSYTPWRNLAGSGTGLPRVLTNYWTISTTSSGIVTQNVRNYMGTTNVVTGTNGQNVSFLVTNGNVQAGYTTSDYGWKWMPNVISNLNVLGEGATVNWDDTPNDWPWVWSNATENAWMGDGTGLTWAAAYGQAEGAAWAQTNNAQGTAAYDPYGTLTNVFSPLAFYRGLYSTATTSFYAHIHKEAADFIYQPTYAATNRKCTVWLYANGSKGNTTLEDWTYTNSLYTNIVNTQAFVRVGSSGTAYPTNRDWGLHPHLRWPSTIGPDVTANTKPTRVAEPDAGYHSLGWSFSTNIQSIFRETSYGAVYFWDYPWTNVVQ